MLFEVNGEGRVYRARKVDWGLSLDLGSQSEVTWAIVKLVG